MALLNLKVGLPNKSWAIKKKFCFNINIEINLFCTFSVWTHEAQFIILNQKKEERKKKKKKRETAHPKYNEPKIQLINDK